ncbi:MAG: DUF4124 domain-containing protein [Woeseiaceae bacterium]|nr:DUF4124 domain-containing protein [Woeseiaceae bacterium]
MNRKQLCALVATATALALSPAMAGDIYRYVDADGNVHYVDRPTGYDSEERLAISSRPTDPAAVQARAQGRYGNDDAAESETGDGESGDDDADRPKTRSEKLAEQRERQKRCEQYRAKLETLVTARRLYRQGEDGERAYLDDAEIDDARARAQQLVEENCG